MLFARFLAENHLLMHPSGVAVSLEECEELAASERAPNGFVLAARYASRMLPQIFRINDVLLDIEFAPEQRLALERLLASLPRETFLADDSLGWVYQFWQTKRKDEVNKSGDKIDGRTLPAVTQLFTEDYMVQFLLHNTIGAWWCARQGIAGPPGGAGVPAGKAPVAMEYLRWKEDGTPATGSFDGWPRSLKEFTMLDPCCGSGHFLVAAFRMLVPLRMHDEGLSVRQACDAVLRENLFGLELDPRCTQIAAFALALAAWTYPGPHGEPSGYRPLPTLNIACSGQGVVGSREDWAKFGNLDARSREGMERLYELFLEAPDLGSLIDPRTVGDDLFGLGFKSLGGNVDRALKSIKDKADPERSALGVAAQGIATAAWVMTLEFSLVATNVPYLGRAKQADSLKKYIDRHFEAGRADLATAFLLRCLSYCLSGGSTAIVTPQSWLSLATYSSFRELLLNRLTWNLVAILGEHAFENSSAAGAFVAMLILTSTKPTGQATFAGLDVSAPRGNMPIRAEEKASCLRGILPKGIAHVSQQEQLHNPEMRITTKLLDRLPSLKDFCSVYEGTGRGDTERYDRYFWEFAFINHEVWSPLLNSPDETAPYRGREILFRWEKGQGDLSESSSVRIRGTSAWGRRSVFIARTSEIRATLSLGETHAQNGVAVVPDNESDLPALWSFCSSEEYPRAVHRLSTKIIVPSSALWGVPFDVAHWRAVALSRYPSGLPEPESDDPTQWIFHGRPEAAIDPLQVATSRLLGYRWPTESDRDVQISRRARQLASRCDELLQYADVDGIVCIPSVGTEARATDRLAELLRSAYGKNWSPTLIDRLLVNSGCISGTSLHEWLLNYFFEQHCKRFHQRPFIWHLWDGRKDGFSCLVNYHKLTQNLLDNLTHSYVQDWINLQAADARSGKPGADLRLDAAQKFQLKLKMILEGAVAVKNPDEQVLSKRLVDYGYDVFVRWKPLSEQPIGWNPDLNDGVRMNIRPFVEAGILRKNPNIKWTKDRGNEPQRPQEEYPWFWPGGTFKGDRVNDVHLTNQEKMDARRDQS